MKKIIAADLFCGAGGESTGLLEACADLGRDIDLLAVNHWEIAIQTHKANHINVNHKCESIQAVDPLREIPGGRLNLLWASPECTHHSNARAGRPRNDQSRASAWLILKWLQELYVDRVIIENIPEFTKWGPLDAKGDPMKSKIGETFTAFCSVLKSLGYRVDHRILCAANFGDPTTRRRFFLQAVRGKNKIKWPDITHTQKPDMFIQKRWIPAKDIIDWSIPGKSIFNRKKPLVPNTIKRIEHGIKKYWGELAEPFLVILRGTGTSRSINRPLPTVTTSGSHFGLIEPFIAIHKGCSMSKDYNKPLSTVTTMPCHSIIEPFITRFNGGKNRNHSINEPLPVVDCSNRYGLVKPFLFKYYGSGKNIAGIDEPLDTVTCKDRFAIIDGDLYNLDIRFRMLLPHELAAAQGFPKNYKFVGSGKQIVRQIGNAVPCNLAKAICKAVLAA